MKISKKMKKYYLIIPILALMVGSCQKEGLDETNVTTIIRPSEEVITGSVTGYIVDENQVAVKDATVSHHEEMTLSDAEGKFTFTDIELYKDGSLLSVRKDGFFQGSKKFYAADDNVIQIQLSPKTFLSDTDASTGGRVDISEAFIVLPGGSYLAEGSQLYDGKVNVYGQWINPADKDDSNEMPGDLTGYDVKGDFKAITCFSMLKVGIEDVSNREIDLPEDKSATINFPIPEELIKFAPEEISLWYFDELNGSWIEEGIAILDNDRYVGEVNRIAAWACGFPSPHVEISASLISDGDILASKKIKLLDTQTGYISYLTTNENGHFTTRIPLNSNLDLEVDHTCSNQPLSIKLGIQSSSNELGLQNLPNTGSGMIQVKGVITDCIGANNLNAYLKVDIGGTKFMINTHDGEFDLPFSTSCSDSKISMVAIELENGYASEKLSHSITERIDLHEIPLCHSVQSGYDFSFSHMNWADQLENEVRHSWTVRTISSSNKKTIFNPRIVNENQNDIVYLSGAFVVIEGSNVVNYLLRCESQGFSISGTCEVLRESHDGFYSYRFFNPSPDPEIDKTDSDIFPADHTSDIEMINFDLVYYD